MTKMEYNIVVIGANLVGKTCLINRFVRGTCVLDNYVPTLEDSYRKTICFDGESCLLEILDTAACAGGQSLSLSTISKIRKGDAFVCVFAIDCVNSFHIAIDLAKK